MYISSTCYRCPGLLVISIGITPEKKTILLDCCTHTLHLLSGGFGFVSAPAFCFISICLAKNIIKPEWFLPFSVEIRPLSKCWQGLWRIASNGAVNTFRLIHMNTPSVSIAESLLAAASMTCLSIVAETLPVPPSHPESQFFHPLNLSWTNICYQIVTKLGPDEIFSSSLLPEAEECKVSGCIRRRGARGWRRDGDRRVCLCV